MDMTTWIIIGVVVFVLLVVIWIYNGLVSKRVQTQNAWSQIDVQLQRRHDLIPNLVEVVKGYAKHESETLEKVVQARSAALGAKGVGDKIAAENQLTGALRGFLAIAEAYPDLKANQNFLALQEELAATENRIGFSRQNYNDTVTPYNASLQSFPSNLLAGMFGFQTAVFFTPDPSEAAAIRQAPKVQF